MGRTGKAILNASAFIILVPNISHLVVVLQVRLLALSIFILLLLNCFLQDPQNQGMLVLESKSVGQSGLKHGSTAAVLKQLKGQEQTVVEPAALQLLWLLKKNLFCIFTQLIMNKLNYFSRGIDVVRNKIKMFAQQKVTLPKGRHKIIILDEADRYVVFS